MKTLELKLKKDVLIIEAPLDAYNISIGTHCIGVITNENVEKDTNGFYHIYKKGLFFGDIDMKLEFLCKGSELTEEIASDLVETVDLFSADRKFYKIAFENYKQKKYVKFYAKESFISAVESKSFHWLENPIEKPKHYDIWAKYGDYTQYGKKLTEECLKWQEAEEKTFRNPLIFVKK